jgi:hypothetical protein
VIPKNMEISFYNALYAWKIIKGKKANNALLLFENSFDLEKP